MWTKRQILNGIFYQLKNGCNWGDLPKDLPPYSTVFWHYQNWCEEGAIDLIMTKLHQKVREQVKKNQSWQPWSWLTLNRWKTRFYASIESKGFCFYKSTNGIKRHLAVDILGFPFFTHCTKASVSDDQGLIEMLTHNIDYFKSKPADLPKTTILLDNGYQDWQIDSSTLSNLPGNYD